LRIKEFTTTDRNVAPCMVESARGLEKACRAMLNAGIVGMDTEFVRTRNFFPKLGLIQVSTWKEIFLVDPLALETLEPLAEVLTSEDVLKIFHSCDEDLEVLSFLCGTPPGPIFDTQVAAAYCGHGFQIGYQGLVQEVLDVELDKGETRSAWLRRPLTSKQVKYAAMDVACLIPIYARLVKQLKDMGRISWVEEEMDILRREAAEEVTPENYYKTLGYAWQYKGRELAVLQTLFEWRESMAAACDLPRNFLMKNKVVRSIADKRPRSLRALSVISEVRPSVVRKHGKDITTRIRRAMELAPEDCPPSMSKPPNPRKIGKIVERLKPIVQEEAARLQLPAELVARRRCLNDLARNHLLGCEDLMPTRLAGWRNDEFGERLLNALKK
jgi:ribonuclease D